MCAAGHRSETRRQQSESFSTHTLNRTKKPSEISPGFLHLQLNNFLVGPDKTRKSSICRSRQQTEGCISLLPVQGQDT